MSIIEKVNELKAAMEEYFGVGHVDIDVKIHSAYNELNEAVLSRFHALGGVEFDGGESSYDNRMCAWLKKRLSPNSEIILYFLDYTEAQKFGYKLPEESEVPENDNHQ
jgi:pantothenate kinase